MHRLHALWHDARLHVWGERLNGDDAPATNGSSSPNPADVAGIVSAATLTRAQRKVDALVIPHPFCLSTEALHAALGEISPDGLLASIAEEDCIELALPARHGMPAPSNITDHPRESNEPAAWGLERFRISVLRFEPADAVDLLTSIPEQVTHEIGESLRFWRTLALYALSLLARERFAPDVETIDAALFEGRWRPLISDPAELAWLEKLVGECPPVCRAVVHSDSSSDNAAQAMDEFLTLACEAVIRRSLDADEFYRDFHERARHESKWELQWISSLVGERRPLAWSDQDAADLARSIRDWADRAETVDSGEFPDVTFMLLEPEIPEDSKASQDDEPAWRVRIGLRSPQTGQTEDIRKIWRERNQPAAIISRRISSRAARLRAELVRAAAVFPQLHSVIHAEQPRDVLLTTEQAHAFIHEQTPLLLAEQFNISLPDWATARQNRLGLELVVRPREERLPQHELSLGSFGLGAMIQFDWRIAVGDARITPEEFESAANRHAPLVRIRGQWVDIDHIAVERAREFMRKHAAGPLTLMQAVRLAAGVDQGEETGLPIVGISAASWLERLFNDMPQTTLDHLDQPADFEGTMRPYQLRGLDWLAFLNRLGIGACLADDMGLGKTIQLIALLLYERKTFPDVGPTLLFVPMSVVGNWHRELQRFGKPLRVLVHHGPDRLTADDFADAAPKHHVVITTYGLAHRDLKALSRVRWHRIALDEAQKIKNPSAHQTIAIRSLDTAHRVALTGTPLENHLSELWSIMETLNPGLLGSAASFRKQFAIPIEKMGDQRRAEQLRRMIRPFVLRRLKNDPLVECDLPEKLEMRVFCNLTTEQAALYKATVRQMLDEIDQAAGIRRRGLILATLTRLKQICNHPAHFRPDGGSLDARSGKCERIVEMLEEVIEEGDAALIFTQYKVMGDLLQRLLEERLRTKVLFLHGGTQAKQRDELVDEFQKPDGRARLFLLSLKAGGFGLNLTRANHVFHFDRWWNPAVEQQATDRAHRIGQQRRVSVYKFVCIGTIEDRIDKLLTEKSALADHIVGSGDEWLTGLSTSELKEYLALSTEAVAES